MSKEKKQHILKFLSQNRRLDGRKKDEYRKITIRKDISVNAEGSAGVRIGETELMVGVKLGVDKPYPDIPEQGVLMTAAELYPMSNPNFESGPPSIQSIELARVIDRGIRESGAIDTKKLCITPGEKVWMVSLDICTINDNGNLFDAAGMAGCIALKNTVFPKISDDGKVSYEEKTSKKLPLNHLPVSVTVLKIGEHFIIDPLPEEEEVLDARLTVAVKENKNICALQKGGEGTITDKDVRAMTELAIKKSEELRGYLK